MPKSATWQASTSTLTVVFNRLLVTGTSAVGNFKYFDGANEWANALPMTVNMKTVSGTLGIGPADPTPRSCLYRAVPPDVIDRNGLPVLAFSGFPVTVI